MEEKKVQTVRPDSELLYDAFTACPLGIAIENLEGQPVFVNSALCVMLGVSEEEMLGKHCVEFSPPEDAAKDWAFFEQLRAGSIDHYQIDKRFFRGDGSTVWGRLSISLLKGATPPLVVAMVEDITEKKKAEKALFRYAAIVESSDDAIVGLDTNGIITNWNKGAERLFGYSAGEAIGENILFLSHDARDDGKAALIKKVWQGEVVRHHETVRRRKDGTGVDISLTVSPLVDVDGQIVGASGIARDITERKRAEARLREYEAVVEVLGDRIMVVDREYRYVLANAAFLNYRGFEKEQVIGHTVAEIVGKETFEADIKEQFDECFQGKVVRYEVKYSYPELGARNIAAAYFPIRGPLGIDRIACVLRDVTERKRAETALADVSRKLLEAHEQERTRIGRDLHDDIVQRLAMLSLELEGVQEDTLDAELRTRIGALVNQTKQIADDVQLMSHELHSKIDHLGIVIAVKNFCKEFGERQKVEIDFESHDLPTGLPTELSLTLFRVLQEALRNAAKHSGVKHFEVRLWGSTGEIQLTVGDLGTGFDTETAMKSTGLGLTSMQERLRLVRGELSINSQPRGGTTIHARVPFDSSSDSARAAG
jgi:PAS domain S-box-containing protein